MRLRMRFLAAALIGATAMGVAACSSSTGSSTATTTPARSIGVRPAVTSTTDVTEQQWADQVEHDLTAKGFKVVHGSVGSGGAGGTFVSLDLVGCPKPVSGFSIDGLSSSLSLQIQTSKVSANGDTATYYTYHFTTQPTPEEVKADGLCGD